MDKLTGLVNEVLNDSFLVGLDVWSCFVVVIVSVFCFDNVLLEEVLIAEDTVCLEGNVAALLMSMLSWTSFFDFSEDIKEINT